MISDQGVILKSLGKNHRNSEYTDNPCNISSGMFGIRYSYSDHYYATDGEDRGCSSTDGSTSFNASQVTCSLHSSSQPLFFTKWL